MLAPEPGAIFKLASSLKQPSCNLYKDTLSNPKSIVYMYLLLGVGSAK
ncbi:hypothetical protein [Clostridium sp. C2-6-12]